MVVDAGLVVVVRGVVVLDVAWSWWHRRCCGVVDVESTAGCGIGVVMAWTSRWRGRHRHRGGGLAWRGLRSSWRWHGGGRCRCPMRVVIVVDDMARRGSTSPWLHRRGGRRCHGFINVASSHRRRGGTLVVVIVANPCSRRGDGAVVCGEWGWLGGRICAGCGRCTCWRWAVRRERGRGAYRVLLGLSSSSALPMCWGRAPLSTPSCRVLVARGRVRIRAGRRRGMEVAHRVFAWARIRCEYLSWGGQRHEVGVAGSPGASPPRCRATLSPLRFVFDAWGRGGDVVVVR